MFCGDDRSKKTAEHAWPDWALRLVGDGAPATVEAQLGPDAPSKTWRDRAVTVKFVCGTCNNGWMSQLEARARLVIGPMISDLSVALHREDQKLLAAWGVKTAMVFEAAKTGEWLYSEPERRELGASLSLPPDTLVWIGRYAHSNANYGEGRRLGETAHDRGSTNGGYATTVALGRFVIQVLTLRLKIKAARTYLHIQPGHWNTASLRSGR